MRRGNRLIMLAAVGGGVVVTTIIVLAVTLGGKGPPGVGPEVAGVRSLRPVEPEAGSAEKPPLPAPVAPVLPPPPEPYTFKGDKLGMSLEDFRKRHVALKEEEKGEGTVSIVGYSRFLTEKVKDNVPLYSFVDGKLGNILISFDRSSTYGSADQFREVLESLIHTYGKPTAQETESYHNGFGAKFEGLVCKWDNGVSSILLQERGTDLKTCLLFIIHNELSKKYTARTKKEPTRLDR